MKRVKMLALPLLWVVQSCLVMAAQGEPIVPSPVVIVPHPDRAPINAMVVSDTNGLFAVGDHGHILKLDGDNWRQSVTPINTLLTDLIAVDAGQMLAIGHDMAIVHSDNGGENWQLVHYDPKVDMPLLALHKGLDNQLFAMGAYGTMLHSLDGGRTWRSHFHSELLHPEDKAYLEEIRLDSEEDYLFERSAMLPHFNGMLTLKNGQLMLFGEQGFVALSSDNGATFQRITTPYMGSWYSAIETQQGTVLAGLTGKSYRTTNFVDFDPITSPASHTINRLLRINGAIFALTNGGAVMQLNGTRWQTVHQLKGSQLTSALLLGDRLWLGGSHGLSAVPFTVTESPNE